MSDIVELLMEPRAPTYSTDSVMRSYEHKSPSSLEIEAASEITRLRADKAALVEALAKYDAAANSLYRVQAHLADSPVRHTLDMAWGELWEAQKNAALAQAKGETP